METSSSRPLGVNTEVEEAAGGGRNREDVEEVQEERRRLGEERGSRSMMLFVFNPNLHMVAAVQ